MSVEEEEERKRTNKTNKQTSNVSIGPRESTHNFNHVILSLMQTSHGGPFSNATVQITTIYPDSLSNFFHVFSISSALYY